VRERSEQLALAIVLALSTLAHELESSRYCQFRLRAALTH